MATRKYSTEIVLRAIDLTRTTVKNIDSQFQKLNGTLTQFERLSKNVTAIGEKFQSVGVRMGAAGAVITGALAFAAKRAVDYQTAMAKIGTVTGESAAMVDARLTPVFSRLSVETGKTTDQLQEAYYLLTSAGVPAAKATEFLDASARSAVGGFTSAKTAAHAAAILFNTYGEAAGSAAEIQNKLHIAQRVGLVEFEQIAANIGDASSMFARAQVPLSEYTGAFAELTKAVSAPEATTQAKALLEAITSPNAQVVTAVKELNKHVSAADKIALGYDEIQKTGFLGWINKFAKSTGGSAEAIEAVTGGNIRAKAALSNLVAVLPSFNKTVGEMNKGLEENNVLEENFAIVSKTAQFRIDQMKVALDNLRKTIGTAVLPLFGALMGIVGRLAIAVGQFAERHKTLTKILAVGAAALGILLIVGGAVAVILGTIGVMVPAIAAGFALIAPVIGTIGAAIGIAAAAILFLIGLFFSLKTILSGIWFLIGNIIKSFIDGFVNGFAPVIDAIQDKWVDFKLMVITVFYTIRDVVSEVIDWISWKINRMIAAVKGTISIIAAAAGKLGMKAGTGLSELLGFEAKVKTTVDSPEAKVDKSLKKVVALNTAAAAKVRATWSVAEGITAGNVFGIAASGARATTEQSIARQYKEGFASEKIASAVASGTASTGKTNQFNIERLELNNATDPDSMIYELERRAAMAGI